MTFRNPQQNGRKYVTSLRSTYIKLTKNSDLRLPRIAELDQFAHRAIPSTQNSCYDRAPAPPRPSLLLTYIDDSHLYSAFSGYPSPVTTESDGSIVYTPPDSRRPSVSIPTSAGSRQSYLTGSAKRSAKRLLSPDELLPYCEDCKSQCQDLPNHRKKLKEKRARKDQADVARADEAILRYVGGWRVDPNGELKQSQGNGNSSGLFGHKIVIQRAMSGVGRHFMEKARIQAMETDTVAEFEAEVADVADTAVAHGSLYCGQLLNYNGDTCIKGASKGSKDIPCDRHKTEDWRECQDRLFQMNYDANVRQVQAKIAQDQANRAQAPQSPPTKFRNHAPRRG